ncbi:MAG: hypothetical protein LZF86_160066 [Nitrospira sp.]|nr:MAG: hypothetical protein LZF86_160066 [Nitrospira sp.]
MGSCLYPKGLMKYPTLVYGQGWDCVQQGLEGKTFRLVEPGEQAPSKLCGSQRNSGVKPETETMTGKSDEKIRGESIPGTTTEARHQQDKLADPREPASPLVRYYLSQFLSQPGIDCFAVMSRNNSCFTITG